MKGNNTMKNKPICFGIKNKENDTLVAIKEGTMVVVVLNGKPYATGTKKVTK